MPQIGKVGADLVGAPGDQPDAAQCKGTALADGRDLGDDLLVPFGFAGVDAHLVAFLAVLQPGDMPPGGRGAHRDGQVFLFHLIVTDDGVHIPQRGVGFGGNDKPLGAAVQPVADRWGKALLGVGVIFALGLQISGKSIHKVGVARAVAVAQKVGGLVQDSDIPVLVNHRHRRLAAGRLFGGGGSTRREKLVVDIQFDQVVLMQARVRLGAFAVDLDALVAERLVHHTAGHIFGDAFNKAAQTNALLVGTGGKAFHGFSPPCKTINKVYNKIKAA